MSAEDPKGNSSESWLRAQTAPHVTAQETEALDAPPAPKEAKGAPAGPGEGPYRLGSVLGEGGMAVVYDAHDPALDRTVAVKVMRPTLAADADLRARFLHEARILGQLEHPGIVPVFAAGALPGHGLFYAMKKVRGRTLREVLRDMQPRDFQDPSHTARLTDIFEHVCQTIAYAHAQGILHRDLKPENVMVDEFGVVVVLDWGLSKKLHAVAEEHGILATEAGVVKGTPAYMSPEQASGSTEEMDFRTDVFSLGIILYEILTGSLPFSGHSRTEVMERVLHHEPPSPRTLNRKAGRALAAICMKALSKDPASRYPTAQELADDIGRYRDLLPTTAYTPGPLERLSNLIGRHRAVSAAVGTALLLFLGFGGFALHRRAAGRIRRAEQAERERLVKQLDEQRQNEKVQKTLLAIRSGVSGLRELDEQILALETRIAALAPDDPARRAFRAEADELDTVRYMASNSLRSSATGLISQLTAKKGGDTSQLDPDILKFFRGIAIESVRALIKRHDYYKAHFYIWDFLRTERDNPGMWTPEQVKELNGLRAEVESKLRETIPAGVPLPDWSKYAPRIAVPKAK